MLHRKTPPEWSLWGLDGIGPRVFRAAPTAREMERVRGYGGAVEARFKNYEDAYQGPDTKDTGAVSGSS
jgi:hypothetical protein